MKFIASFVAAIAVFSMSSVYAAPDIDINVHDVGIWQAQDGYDLSQHAAIANVNNEFDGEADIYVHDASIVQLQKGQGGKQSATIATICDCDYRGD